MNNNMEIEDAEKANADDIKKLVSFEKDNEIELPGDYRHFLIENNGGRPIRNVFYLDGKPFSDVQVFYSLRSEPEHNFLFYKLFIFEGRIPDFYLPVATDSFGNQYLLSLREQNFGCISFWDHETELKEGDASEYFDNIRWLANSFDEFCRLLQPYSDSGD